MQAEPCAKRIKAGCKPPRFTGVCHLTHHRSTRGDPGNAGVDISHIEIRDHASVILFMQANQTVACTDQATRAGSVIRELPTEERGVKRFYRPGIGCSDLDEIRHATLFGSDRAHVLPGRRHDRLDDIVVPGTAADIAFQILPNLML